MKIHMLSKLPVPDMHMSSGTCVQVCCHAWQLCMIYFVPPCALCHACISACLLVGILQPVAGLDNG